MFNKQNFCHIASNNRNDVKAGVFVYKTTDDLATVLVSGYFNDKIIDINLHDLIIHEWHDPADRTKVQKNILCVVERTLDNVGTAVIKSKWEGDIEQELSDLETYVDATFVRKDGDTMTGPLMFTDGTPAQDCGISKVPNAPGLTIGTAQRQLILDFALTGGMSPSTNATMKLGSTALKWRTLYAQELNNGHGIAIPETTQAETLALKSDVDLAANSGRMITDEGVWYAKMDAAGTIPAEAEVEGRNYADFTQVDVDNNPIIVIYTYTSGAWTQTETITPPAEYDGYVPVTSKIWDIQEQAGQQGGRILWNHQSKDFTPYPLIISFEDAHLTGDSTVVMPLTPSGSSIVNVDYLTTHTGSGKNVGDVFFTMRTDSGLSGAVECNGDTYNTEDFVGAGAISALLEAGKIPYVNLATYATLLSNNGSVGVFGWDGIGTTTFRVPSLNDIFIETGTAAQIGDYLSPGVPNLKGYLGVNSDYSDADGVLIQKTYLSNNSHGHDGSATQNNKFDIDCSRMSSVYRDDVSTVQPNAVRYRAMVQLATGATDEALETCTSVLADVAANTAAIAGADYVVESQLPTALNNYTWYRKYKSGWVEQGGRTTHANASGVNTTVTLPVEMSDTNYNVQVASGRTDGVSDSAKGIGFSIIDENSFAISMYTPTGWGSQSTTFSWEVKGMAA